MSHLIIIISKVGPAPGENTEDFTSYEYKMPVPHDATPQQVADMTRKAYKKLEALGSPAE